MFRGLVNRLHQRYLSQSCSHWTAFCFFYHNHIFVALFYNEPWRSCMFPSNPRNGRERKNIWPNVQIFFSNFKGSNVFLKLTPRSRLLSAIDYHDLIGKKESTIPSKIFKRGKFKQWHHTLPAPPQKRSKISLNLISTMSWKQKAFWFTLRFIYFNTHK